MSQLFFLGLQVACCGGGRLNLNGEPLGHRETFPCETRKLPGVVAQEARGPYSRWRSILKATS